MYIYNILKNLKNMLLLKEKMIKYPSKKKTKTQTTDKYVDLGLIAGS